MASSNRADVVRKQLFERYDTLNSLWAKAEEQLTKLHIPRPVCYTYSSYQPCEWSGEEFCFCLGLQKVKGAWRICHGTYYDQSDPYEPTDWTPIADCSAEYRVKAAAHLPGLRSAVIESAEKFVPEVDKAIAALSKGLASCDKASSNPSIPNGKA